MNYVGTCIITGELMSYPENCWIRFNSELLCLCHDQFARETGKEVVDMKRFNRIETISSSDLAEEITNRIIHIHYIGGDLGWQDFFYDHYSKRDRENFIRETTKEIRKALEELS